jgi:hypothetical protein
MSCIWCIDVKGSLSGVFSIQIGLRIGHILCNCCPLYSYAGTTWSENKGQQLHRMCPILNPIWMEKTPERDPLTSIHHMQLMGFWNLYTEYKPVWRRSKKWRSKHSTLRDSASHFTSHSTSYNACFRTNWGAVRSRIKQFSKRYVNSGELPNGYKPT